MCKLKSLPSRIGTYILPCPCGLPAFRADHTFPLRNGEEGRQAEFVSILTTDHVLRLLPEPEKGMLQGQKRCLPGDLSLLLRIRDIGEN